MDLSARSGEKRRSGVSGINPTRRDVFAFTALGLVAVCLALAVPVPLMVS
jgi:hypothetical protein